MRVRTPALIITGVAALAVTACSTAATTGPQVTLTTWVDAPSPSGTAGSGTSPSPSTSATNSSAAPGSRTKLNGNCDTRMPASAVMATLGRDVAGDTSFVVGTAEPSIGRIGYLNCRYGLPKGGGTAAATPMIEIGVSLYRTPDKAAARIPATVDDYEAHGAQASTATVAGHDATILSGGTGPGYTSATLVLSADQRTVAVSLDPSATTADRRDADLTKLAEFALQRTAH